MPRILGVDIPPNKKLEYSLRYIYGIGLSRAAQRLSSCYLPVDLSISCAVSGLFYQGHAALIRGALVALDPPQIASRSVDGGVLEVSYPHRLRLSGWTGILDVAIQLMDKEEG